MPSEKSSDDAPGLDALTRKGWTLRPAAERIGVSHVHLYLVLLGQRSSRRVLSAVAALPRRHKRPTL